MLNVEVPTDEKRLVKVEIFDDAVYQIILKANVRHFPAISHAVYTSFNLLIHAFTDNAMLSVDCKVFICSMTHRSAEGHSLRKSCGALKVYM